MTRILLAITVFVLLAVLPAQAAWLDSNFTKRIKVTIDANKVNGDLANFPVFVDLNGMPASFFTTIKDNGADLRVTKTDGNTEVPFELVYLDTNNGAGELHFQANGTLSGTSNSDWYLYYGYNGASAYARDDTYGSENVWSQGYVAVYHMNQDPSGYLSDSSSRLINGSFSGSMDSNDLLSSPMGYALDFDGIDDYVSLLDSVNPEAYTISAYINSDSVGARNIFVRTSSSGANAHWSHQLRINASGKAEAYLYASGTKQVASTSTLTSSTWVYLTASSSDNNFEKIYYNGNFEGSVSLSASMWAGGDRYHLASQARGMLSFDGQIDEIRFSSVVRSNEWINTEFNNINSPDSFYTISSVENGVPVANGLVAWWDASDLSTLVTDSNGQVSEWIDKSGNGNNGTQASSTYQPYSGIATINNLNVLSSNGGKMSFDVDSIAGVKSAFVVLRYNGSTQDGGYLGPIRVYGNSYIYENDGATDLDIRTGYNRMNSSLIVPWEVERPSDETYLLSHVTTGGDFSVTKLANAQADGGTRAWRGEYAELVLYDRVLSFEEIGQVESYLSNKWGISSDLNVTGQYPIDNGSYVIPSVKELSIDFSNDVGVASGNVSLYLANGDLVEAIDVTSGQVTGNGTSSITIALSSNMDLATDYYVNIDNGAFVDIQGNEYPGISNSTEWNFSTRSEVPITTNGLKAWYDASDSSSMDFDSNGAVSHWHNILSGDYTGYQEDSSLRPLLNKQINSLDVLSSNGNKMSFDVDLLTGIKSAFVVLRYNGTTQDGGYLGPIRVHGNIYIYENDGATDSDIRTGYNRMNSSLIVPWEVERPSDETYLLSHVTTGGDFSVTKLANAQADGGTRAWRGEYAELVLYDRVLTEAEISDVESYLADKWGFELNYSSVSPVDDSGSMMPGDDLTMTFPQAVDILNGNLSIFEANGDLFETIDVNSGQVTGNGTTTISFNPSSDLNPLSDYYVQIQGGAFTDAANGNTAFTGIYNNTEWNFTTGRAFDPSGFSNSKKITILHSQVNGDVNNFPVYLDLGHMPSSFFSVVKADGSDIRVTNSAQNEEMPFELVSIDKSAKTGELWFRADSLSGTSNSDFYLWYGNGDASAYSSDHLYGSENVWSQGYVAVYHMNENPNGDVVDVIKDSTSYANHGTPSGSMTSDDLVDGQVGKAIDFDGVDDFITASDDSSLDVSYVTLSAWVNRHSSSGYPAPVAKGYWDGGGEAYGLHLRQSSNNVWLDINDSGVRRYTQVASAELNQWESIAATVSSSAMKIYVDDSLLNTTALTSASLEATSHDVTIGRLPGISYLDGELDEIRISNYARSANWIKTEFNNQSSAETFYLIDDQVPGTETSKPMFMMGGY